MRKRRALRRGVSCTMLLRVFGLAFMISLGAFALDASPAKAAPELRSYSAQRFIPKKTREGVIDGESARISAREAVDLSLWLHYARNPIMVYEDRGGGFSRVGGLVRDRLDGNIILSYAFLSFFELGIDLGVTFYQTRADALGFTGQMVPLSSLDAVGLGDVRVLPKLQLLRAEDFGIDLALIGQFSVPTGNGEAYLGDDGPTVSPGLAISREFKEGFRVVANLGARLRPAVGNENVDLGKEWFYRVGYAYHLGPATQVPIELGLAVSGETELERPFQSSTHSPLEILGQVSYDIVPAAQIFVGGGAGVGRGVGAPDVRVFAGFSYADRDRDRDNDGIDDRDDSCPTEPEDRDGFEDLDGCPEADNDADGVLDAKDRCPDEAGLPENQGCPDPDTDGDGIGDGADKCPKQPGPAENHGCPDRDTDKDGIIDRLDECPGEPEDLDGIKDEDGCPDLDDDGDGVLDAADGCPKVPGPVENRGCPDTDRDGDGVMDRVDNCPDEPGPAENQGCKKRQLVQITAQRLEILDMVYFQSGKSKLLRRSNPLLNNIAAVLNAHPEIERIIIEGHTDNVGSDKLNLRLSQQRAEAVRNYLVKKGFVDAKRVEARGHGESKPIATNETSEGRATNRRVEFNILGPSGSVEE